MFRSSRLASLRSFIAFAVIALVAGFAPVARAADGDAKLKVGDPAPKLSIARWVKGEPVKGFEKGKVYVVEFWATWCGPCKVSIPHVTKLQQKYADKGLTVIGVDIWEKDVPAVEPFVKEMGDKMGYAVGIEEPVPAAGEERAGGLPKGRMALDWMEPAGQDGIPCSFLVDREGKVAWIGHPMAMDRPLAKIIDGTFDAKAEAALLEKVDKLNEKAAEAAQKKDYDASLKLRDEIVAADPDQADQQRLLKLVTLGQKGDDAAANKLAGELADRAAAEKDGMLAARTAAMLLGGPGAAKADKAVILRAAQTAYDLSDKAIPYRRLLAQALAANGQYAKAVELQKSVAEEIVGPLKARDEKALEEYKAKAGNK